MDWPYDKLDTVDAGTFYLDVARAGIQYGPHFRMVERRHISGSAVVLRCGSAPARRLMLNYCRHDEWLACTCLLLCMQCAHAKSNVIKREHAGSPCAQPGLKNAPPSGYGWRRRCRKSSEAKGGGLCSRISLETLRMT